MRARRLLACGTALASATRATMLSRLPFPPRTAFVGEVGAGLRAVQEAMAMASKVQRGVESMTKGDLSPVTVADFAAQAMVLSRLRAAYPEDGFIAEESSENMEDEFAAATSAAAEMSKSALKDAIDLGGIGWDRGRRWILDPIDGTKGFLRGEQFCCALCLLVDGSPAASVLGCPNLDSGTFAVALKGAGAFVFQHGAWSKLAVSDAAVGDGLRLVEGVARSHSNHDWSDAAFRSLGRPTEPVRLDSQAKAVVLSMARADAFLRLPKRGYVEKVWDAAPAALLVQEAGGVYSDRRGRPIDFSRGDSLDAAVDGIVATNKRLHPHLVDALTRTQHLQD